MTRSSLLSVIAWTIMTTAPLVSQTAGYAVQFDGIDDDVNCGNQPSLSPADALTIEAWVYAEEWSGSRRIVQKGATDNQYRLFATETDLVFDIMVGGSRFALTASLPSVQDWHHVAALYSGSSMQLWVDGNLSGERTDVTGSLDVSEDPLLIGAKSAGDSSANHFSGMIDEVRIWTAARTGQEIREAMFLLIPGQANLSGSWRFDEGSGTAAADYSGYENHGILENGTDWVSSTVPLGTGASASKIISTAESAAFSGLNLLMEFASKDGTDTVTVATISGSPQGTQPAGVTTLAPNYWVVQKHGPGTFNADVTFGFASGAISLEDQEVPGKLKLFRRDIGSGGSWTLIASAVRASFGSVSFSGITSFSEFAIGTTGSSSFAGTGAVFQSTGTGDWNAAETWLQTGGTDEDGIPDANDDVTIRAGETVTATSGAACNNLLLQGASTGTRLTAENADVTVYGTINADDTTLSPSLIQTPGGHLNFAGGSRPLFGNRWSADAGGWALSINLNGDATGTISTHIRAGSFNQGSGTTEIGTDANPRNLYVDATLACWNSVLDVSGSILKTDDPTDLFSEALIAWSTLEIGGAFISADVLHLGYVTCPYYCYHYPSVIRVKSPVGLSLTASQVSVVGTFEYAGTSPQTTGNELPSSIWNLVINNPSGVQFLTSTRVEGGEGMLTLAAGNLTIPAGVSLYVQNFLPGVNEVNGDGDVTVEYSVATAHADGLDGTFKNSGSLNFGGSLAVTYNGSTPQSTGLRQPSSFNSLAVNNGSGVTFSRSATVNYVTLTEGDVTLDDTLTVYNLTVNENEIHGSGLFSMPSGNFLTQHVNGIDGTLQTSGYWLNGPAISFQFNRPTPQTAGIRMPDSVASLTHSSDLTLSRSLYVPAYNIEAQGGDVTVSSGASFSTSSFNAGATGKLVGEGSFQLIDGGTYHTHHPDGVDGTIQLSGSVQLGDSSNFAFFAGDPQVTGSLMADTVFSLHVQTGSTLTPSKPVHIHSILWLYSGTFDNGTSNVILANGATVHRYQGNITAAPGYLDFYNVIYHPYDYARYPVGPEVPDSSTVLRDFGGGPWAILTKNITVNGTLSNHVVTDTFALRVTGQVYPGYMVFGNLIKPVAAPGSYQWEVSDPSEARHLPLWLTVNSLQDSGDVLVHIADTASSPLQASPEGVRYVRYYHRVKPGGLSGLNGEITLQYTDEDVTAAGIPDDDSLIVFQWREPSWVALPTTSRDVDNNRITAGPVDTLTDFLIAGTPLKGDVELSTTSIDFGNVKVAISRPDSFVIRNIGEWPLEIHSIGPTHSDFGVSMISVTTIPVGDSATVYVHFVPTVTGLRAGLLLMYHNGEGGIDTVAVSGTGVEPSISLSKNSVDFGDVAIGESKKDSLYISNTGTYPLVLTGIVLSDEEFSAWPDTATVQPGDSLKVLVSFTPASEGVKGGWFYHTHNLADAGVFSVSLSGTATASRFVVEPTELDFGTVPRGVSKVDSVLVTNPGTSVLHITSIASTDGQFAASPQALDIPAGDSAWFTILFSPTHSGEFVGSVIFHHSAVSSPDTAAVSGKGVEPLFSANRTSIGFGNITIGQSKVDSVVVTNTGTADLIISSVTSSDSAQFKVAPNNATVAPGIQQMFTVQFLPGVLGSQEGTVTFTHNAQTGTNVLNVTGNGVLPIFTVSRTTVSFGDVRVDSTEQDTITVTNTGNISLVISSVTSTDGQFVVSPTSVILAPSAKREFTLSFTPASRYLKQSDLLFTHNGVGSPDTVRLNGNGIDPSFAAAPLLDFGRVRVHRTKSDSISVSNDGNMPLTIFSAVKTGSEFTILPNAALVPAGDSTWFVATFRPDFRGQVQGHVVFSHDYYRSTPDTVLLTGLGVEPLFAASRTEVSFDTVRVHREKTDTVTIHNAGNMELTISGIAHDAEDYTIEPTIAVVPEEGSLPFAITFQPGRRGMLQDVFIFQHDADSSPDSVSTQGVGVEPLFVSSVNSVNFGDVRAGRTKVDTIEVTNPGNMVLTISAATLKEQAFHVVPPTASVAPSGTVKLAVTFLPAGPGFVLDTLLFVHDGDSSPDGVLLSGKGVEPAFSVSPARLDFGIVIKGEIREDSLMVRNDGTGELSISEIVVTDTLAFSVDPGAGVIPAGGNRKFTVFFDPPGTSVRSGNIVFVHDAQSARDTVTVQGKGLEVVSLSAARGMPNGTEVAFEGIVTRALGASTRIQDTSAGIVVQAAAGAFFDSVSSGGIRAGDLVRINGRTSELNALKQISQADFLGFERLSRNQALPEAEAVTLAELRQNGEHYESELVTVSDLQVVFTSDTSFAAAHTYSVVDPSDTSRAVSVYIPGAGETEVDGMRITRNTFSFAGVVSQFSAGDPSAGYQLVPVFETDIVTGPTGVDGGLPAGIPTEYVLYTNFPNPFNPSTTIRYGVPEQSTVFIGVYDILGRRIAVVAEGTVEAGYQQVTWSSAVSSGMYFYRIESQSVQDPKRRFTQTKRMILVR